MPKRVSVLVIGGSHAVLAVSQKLLRQTSRVAPESFLPSKYLYSIPDAFREYPVGAFAIIKELIIKIDCSTKSVFDRAGAIYEAQEKLRAARWILIGGSGLLGKVTLVSRGSRTVLTHARVYKLKLSTGHAYKVNTYIATMGTIPNNALIPKSTYAVSNITCHPYQLFSRVSLQGETVTPNIVVAIENRVQVAMYSAAALKNNSCPCRTIIGDRVIRGWMLFGCLVRLFKYKDFLTYQAPRFLRGQTG
ncbi:uncharacterized protein BJX67DRAFT_373308 [Aspergillus lucknowensis]|uniref:FAD/NAD(P)-binding domain-containing protein n=1 Tax=Aspergillus lucknowensis TaxID=176173 RepID=A0ABR4LL29_9EURO